jgi:hypothetical protein
MVFYQYLVMMGKLLMGDQRIHKKVTPLLQLSLFPVLYLYSKIRDSEVTEIPTKKLLI